MTYLICSIRGKTIMKFKERELCTINWPWYRAATHGTDELDPGID